MKVWVILEEDRGCGVSVVGVFRDKEAAEKVLSENPYRYQLFEEKLV